MNLWQQMNPKEAITSHIHEIIEAYLASLETQPRGLLYGTWWKIKPILHETCSKHTALTFKRNYFFNEKLYVAKMF